MRSSAGAELETLAGELHAAERELLAAIEMVTAMEAEHYVALYRVRHRQEIYRD